MRYLFRTSVNYAMPVFLLVLLCVPHRAQSAQSDQALTTQAHSKGIQELTARISTSYGKLPISFESNPGQAVQFVARGAGYTLFLSPGEALLTLKAPSQQSAGRVNASHSPLLGAPTTERQISLPSDTVRMQLIGSNPEARAAGVDALPGKSNYFLGNDSSKWRTDVPTYAKVRYSSVYPGVDLLYYGNQEGRLEHDFVVAPGADPGKIVISLGDDHNVIYDNNGDLDLPTTGGQLVLRRPFVYQITDGSRRTVSADYALAGDRISFRIGAYDKAAPLIIDPVLVYSAVFGGTQDDLVSKMTIDSAGNVYIIGGTYSIDYPTVDPFQSSWTPSGESPTAVFVSKLNASGTALLYSTFLGGPFSFGDAIAVGASGKIYIAGLTGSGFPIKNAYQPTYAGNVDAFATVLSPDGDSLIYSTYLGGSGQDYATSLALDASENLYITGPTEGGFPALHSIQPQGMQGVYVAKFNSSGALQYSSMYGNILGQSGGIAVDSTGAAYIAGYTNAAGVTITPGAFQSKCTYASCGWVGKLDPSGSSLVYSTYLNVDGANPEGIVLDNSNDVFVAGTAGKGLPVYSHGFQKKFGGGDSDGFVLKLNATGTSLLWSTYLGGSGEDYILGLAVDQYRQVYVAGVTCSPNFPLQASVQKYVGDSDNPCQYFVATLSPSLSSIPYYSTLMGTASRTSGVISIAVGPSLNVYVAGDNVGTISATPGALKTGSSQNPGGGSDVFVSKLVIEDDLSLALSSTPAVHGNTMTYTIAVTSKGPDFGSNVQVADTLPAGTTFVSYGAGDGSCTAPAVGSAGRLNCELQQLNKGSTWDVTLTVQVNAPSGAKLSDIAVTMSNTQDFIPGNNQGTLTTTVN